MGEVKYFKIRGLRYAFVAGYRYALVPGTAETERSRGLRFGWGLSLRFCCWHRGDRARARRHGEESRDALWLQVIAALLLQVGGLRPL